jgi:hypothetical protein
MKIFTLDHRFVLEKIGNLSEEDKKAVSKSLRESLKDWV